MEILNKLNIKFKDNLNYNDFLENSFNPHNYLLFKLKYTDKFQNEKINKQYWMQFYPELYNQKLSVFKNYRQKNRLNIKNSLITLIKELDNSIIDLNGFKKLFDRELEDKLLYQIFLNFYNIYTTKINIDFKMNIPINHINFYYEYDFKKNQFILDGDFIKNIYNNSNPEQFLENNFDKPIIYSYKQLYNLGCKIKNDIVYYQNNTFPLQDFCLNFLPSLTTQHFFKKIQIIKENYLYNNILFLIFIGNNDLGDEILLKVYEKYGKKIHLGIIITNNSDYYNKSKIVSRFESVTLGVCNEYGNDITPSLILYNYLKEKYEYKQIFKLHTKSDQKLRQDLINKLLNINLNELNYKLKNNNVYNHENLKEIDKLNIEYYKKYIKNIKTKKFVAFSIFYTNNILMDKIIDFINNNNFTVLFTFNMYDNNWNVKNTPYHFIERLFYMIK